MARTMDVSVIVSLRDRLTQPLRALTNRFQAFARGVGVVGATIAGLSFLGPIQQATAFDQQLRDMAVTAGLTGDRVNQFIGDARAEFKKLARDVGQTTEKLTGGANFLQASNMDPELIKRLMPVIGKVATAARAEVLDIASTTFSLSDSMKVAADDMERALAILVTQGKLGRFELKAMAREFPGLTGQMGKLGETGLKATAQLGAMLQVAMKGTSDPAQAANNLKNFLSKIAAPETIKRFKDQGVDIVGVMKDAATKNISPIEAVIQKIGKLSGVSTAEIQKQMAAAKKAGMTDAEALGKVREQIEKIGGAAKLGTLFGDQQVLDFLIPMMAFLDEYKDIRDKGLGAGVKVIDDDWKTQIQAPGKALEMLSEAAWQLGERMGRSFFPFLKGALDAANAVLDLVDALDAANPGSLDAILAGVGGLGILAMALGAVSFVLPIVTAGFSLLLGVLAAVLSPIGLVVAALTIAGLHIARNWSRFKPMFQRGADGLKDVVSGFSDWWTGFWTGDFARAGDGARRMFAGLGQVAKSALDIVGNLAWDAIGAFDSLAGTDIQGWMKGIIDRFNELGPEVRKAAEQAVQVMLDTPRRIYDAIDGGVENFRTWGEKTIKAAQEGASSAWAGFVAWLKGLPAQVSGAVSGGLDALRAWGAAMIQSVIDGAKQKVEELIAWFKSLPGMIKDAIGSIDLSNIIQWPSFPSLFGGGAGSAAPSGAPAPSGDPAPGLSTDDTGGVGRQGSIAAPSSRQFAAVSPAAFAGPQSAPRPQPVDVGGTVTVKVIGPAQVTGTSSTNPNVPVTTAGGRGPTAAMA